MESRWPLARVAAVLAALGSAASLAEAQDCYQKKATWRETIRASIYAKEHPGTTKGPREKPGVWTPVTSGVIRFKEDAKPLKVDVSGQTYLALIASDAGDGIGCDHAVWADAKLVAAGGKSVWLDTLKPVGVTVGWGQFFAGEREISIGNAKFARHIWAHAKSVVCYELDPKQNYKTLEVHVGIDNRANGGSVDFTIDNKEVRGGSSGLGPLWQRMLEDFPKDANRILVAYDWCRREKLDIESPAGQFEPKTREILEQAKKVLAFVERDDCRPGLAAELKGLEGKVTSGGDWRELYLDVHDLRRRIIFSHPALDFEKILINRNPPTTYSHNGDQHQGQHSRAGPGLTILSDWKSGNPKVDAILEKKLPTGATRNPDLHYDAGKVAFAFCDHTRDGRKRYFLYEAAIDGSWVKQLTGTRRDKFETWDSRATVMIEDNDPCYMPDDNIVFVSTRGQSFGRCHGGRYNPAWILYKCDRNGDNITQLSFGNENEYEPSMLHDGRIVYTRWEYTDRHEMLFHMLWWTRPDGTAPAHFYGNDTLHPMMVVEATAMPGTHKVVATAMGHHSYNTGTIVVLDTNKGENYEQPVTHITPETPYSESQGWPNPHYSHPYPVTEEIFLSSRANHEVHPQGSVPPEADRAIYLVDPFEGRELIYEDLRVASFSPIPIKTRPRPRVIPPTTPPNAPDWGTLFLQNAYLTRNDPEGRIKPGMVKAIRINALGVQPRANRTHVSQGCPNEIPKKVLGTVPVDKDGSAFFKVPARMSLQVQTLDENGMAILTEKSLFYLQPGENRSCVGCHEPTGTSPVSKPGGVIAGRKLVDLQTVGPQYPGGLSFMRTVQPVLDRYCIKCHGLEDTKKGVNLIHDGNIGWPRPYLEIVKRGDHRLGEKGYMWDEKNISRPFTFYAHGNKVAHMIAENHSKVNMDRESMLRIMEFLDLNAQCYGDLFPNKLEERGIDGNALNELRAYARQLFGEKIAGQPDRALVNVAQPDESRILMAPLAAEAGGWGQISGWKSKNDPGYRKMAQLAEKCITRRPNENTNGWQPTLEQGGGEDWVMEERRKYKAMVGAK